MPVASSWVRKEPVEGTKSGSVGLASAPKPETAAGARTHPKQRHSHSNDKRKKVPKASTWTPEIAAKAAAEAKREAARAKDTKARIAADLAAKKAAKQQRDAEVAKLKRDAELLRQKRLQREAEKRMQEATRRKEEEEKEMEARNAAAAMVAAIEGSENLKRKRQEFEEQNRDFIREQERLEESRRRHEASMNDQRELLAHILKHHSSYYELLKIPENSSVQVVKRARRQLLSKVHPDQCKLERAPEAFYRVNEAAEKLIAQGQ